MNKFKLSILSFALMLCCLPGMVSAQKPVRQYMKNNGSQVKKEKDADYIRVFQKESKEDELFTLTEYYPDQQVKRTGMVPDMRNSPAFHGLMTSFYPNGHKKAEVNYEEGRPVGPANSYYENGQLRKSMIYAIQDADNHAKPVPDTVLRYLDSLGTVLVTDGNGFVREVDEDQDYEEGEYQGGVREGEWTGTFLKQQYSFAERYRNGVLLSGISKDTVGKEYKYYDFGTPPKYGRGSGNSVDYFRQTVMQRFKLPANISLRSGLNGQIRVGFVINEEGKPTEFEVLEDPGHGLGREAINAVKAAGNWTPGYKRGVPVRVKYTIPMRVNVAAQRN